MKRTFLSISLILGALLLGAPAFGQQAIVNEAYRGATAAFATGDSFIEILLVTNHTAAQVNALFVGDSNTATAAKVGAYRFQAMGGIAANFPAGTIITVVGNTSAVPEDLVYAPLAVGGDWNITLKVGVSTTYLLQVTAGMSFDGGDVAWVDTVGTGATISANGFGLSWDISPGVFGTAPPCNVVLSAGLGLPGQARGIFGTLAAASTGAGWLIVAGSSGTTPGLSNGVSNTTYVDSLRATLPVELMSFDVQ